MVFWPGIVGFLFSPDGVIESKETILDIHIVQIVFFVFGFFTSVFNKKINIFLKNNPNLVATLLGILIVILLSGFMEVTFYFLIPTDRTSLVVINSDNPVNIEDKIPDIIIIDDNDDDNFCPI